MKGLWADRTFRITIQVTTVVVVAGVVLGALSARTVGVIPLLGFLALWHARPALTVDDELEQFLRALR